jgi:hypothetical protein
MKNRRKFSRMIPVNAECELKIGGEKLKCELLEDSIGGMKVGGLDLLLVPQDAAVELNYRDFAQQGCCRSICRGEGNRFEMGIMLCDETSRPTTGGLLVGCFVRCHDNMIACRPIGLSDDGRVRLQIHDGKEFVIARKFLVGKTRNERARDLYANPAEVQFASKNYGLNVDNATDRVETIVDFEFGMATKERAIA